VATALEYREWTWTVCLGTSEGEETCICRVSRQHSLEIDKSRHLKKQGGVSHCGLAIYIRVEMPITEHKPVIDRVNCSGLGRSRHWEYTGFGADFILSPNTQWKKKTNDWWFLLRPHSQQNLCLAFVIGTVSNLYSLHRTYIKENLCLAFVIGTVSNLYSLHRTYIKDVGGDCRPTLHLYKWAMHSYVSGKPLIKKIIQLIKQKCLVMGV
jgi:hypothetical protein